MIRTTLAAAALLLAAPAFGQSFHPNLFGERYCDLRAMGIPADAARTAALKDAWSSRKEPVMVPYNGKQVSLDVIDAANHVTRNCPQYAK